MSSYQAEILLIAVVTTSACVLPGVFLVLRRMALMSDAISHAILPGIVVAFFLTEDLASPLLVLGAALTGVLTVFLVELLSRTRLVKEDAAIGLVFPALFSLGVILISRYAGGVHLDTDAVFNGDLVRAPLERLVISGWDLGPKSLYVMGVILLVNVGFITFFYKELKISAFDAGLAAALGFSPVIIHYALMTLVSVTAVGAFDAVGSILVVALMITPPAAAYLLTDHLGRMIWLSLVIGAASAIGGYWIAHLLHDASIAGSMAAAAGLLFGVVFLAAPDRGYIVLVRRRAKQRWEFALRMLTVHLFNHEDLPEADEECREEHLHEHISWSRDFASRVVRYGERRSALVRRDGRLELTEDGRRIAQEAIVN